MFCVAALAAPGGAASPSPCTSTAPLPPPLPSSPLTAPSSQTQVTCVIDTGRVKEMRFDAARGIARLQETFVSQAAAQQRRGRAGRVRPGTCYRLFSSKSWDKMPRDTPPEIRRAPLQVGLLVWHCCACLHAVPPLPEWLPSWPACMAGRILLCCSLNACSTLLLLPLWNRAWCWT